MTLDLDFKSILEIIYDSQTKGQIVPLQAEFKNAGSNETAATWTKPYTLTVPDFPNYAGTLKIKRTYGKSSAANIGEIYVSPSMSNTARIYWGDVLTYEIIPQPGYEGTRIEFVQSGNITAPSTTVRGDVSVRIIYPPQWNVIWSGLMDITGRLDVPSLLTSRRTRITGNITARAGYQAEDNGMFSIIPIDDFYAAQSFNQTELTGWESSGSCTAEFSNKMSSVDTRTLTGTCNAFLEIIDGAIRVGLSSQGDSAFDWPIDGSCTLRLTKIEQFYQNEV